MLIQWTTTHLALRSAKSAHKEPLLSLREAQGATNSAPHQVAVEIRPAVTPCTQPFSARREDLVHTRFPSLSCGNQSCLHVQSPPLQAALAGCAAAACALCEGSATQLCCGDPGVASTIAAAPSPRRHVPGGDAACALSAVTA